MVTAQRGRVSCLKLPSREGQSSTRQTPREGDVPTLWCVVSAAPKAPPPGHRQGPSLPLSLVWPVRSPPGTWAAEDSCPGKLRCLPRQSGEAATWGIPVGEGPRSALVEQPPAQSQGLQSRGLLVGFLPLSGPLWEFQWRSPGGKGTASQGRGCVAPAAPTPLGKALRRKQPRAEPRGLWEMVHPPRPAPTLPVSALPLAPAPLGFVTNVVART